MSDLATAIATNAEIERQRAHRMERGFQLSRMRDEIDRFRDKAQELMASGASYMDKARRMQIDADALAKELSLLPALPPLIDLQQFQPESVPALQPKQGE